MQYRSIFSVLAVVSAMIAAARLIYSEQAVKENGLSGIAPSETQHKRDATVPDKLLDMNFVAGDRAANLKTLGLTDKMIKDAERSFRIAEANQMLERLDGLIEDAENRSALQEEICSTSSALRPRYTALGWLVQRKGTKLQVIEPERTSQLKRQDWIRSSTVNAIYNKLDRTPHRLEDAPLMIVAAVLAGQEEAAREGYTPWGFGGAGNWSWEEVVKRNPGIERECLNYFVLMHLLLEVANKDGGLCE
jgi:hypothetical protein